MSLEERVFYIKKDNQEKDYPDPVRVVEKQPEVREFSMYNTEVLNQLDKHDADKIAETYHRNLEWAKDTADRDNRVWKVRQENGNMVVPIKMELVDTRNELTMGRNLEVVRAKAIGSEALKAA